MAELSAYPALTLGTPSDQKEQCQNSFYTIAGVESVFSLLGQTENDITFSMGWALSRSPLLLQNFLQKALRTRHCCDLNRLVVALQEYQKGSGITDIEIR